MHTFFQRLQNAALGFVAVSIAVSCTAVASNAQALQPVAGVQLNNGFKSNGAETTFISADPAFDDYNAYELTPAFRSQFPSVGVNFPPLHGGKVLNVGKFENMTFFYEVPDDGANVDPGLRIYVQGNDGFLHISNSSLASGFSSSANGYNVYGLSADADQFTPSMSGAVLQKANIQYSATANGHPTIYFIYPSITGEKGQLQYYYFTFNTTNDAAFN